MSSKANAVSTGVTSFEEQWAALLAETSQKPEDTSRLHLAKASSYQTVSDVRVAPLVQSKWAQGQWNGYNTFNYYTPNNYVSGCPATAFAQIMRYWCAPTWYVSPMECSCGTNCVDYTCEIMGGTYDWDYMPFTEAECTSERQRRAIGKLLYDVGAASQTGWSTNASGTFVCMCAQALRKCFGYASARSFMSAPDVEGNPGYLTDNISTSADFRNAILASLDAEMPVAVAIAPKTSGGHVVVVDGYGYNGSSLVYCHINCGWSGSEDLWYNLIGEGVTSGGYKSVWEVAYNIHPYVDGEVISGRVVDSEGYPVVNATVTLASASGSDTTRTNAKGIYSFRATPSVSYTITASYAGLSPKSRTVTLPAGGDTDFTITDRSADGGTSFCWPSGMEHPFGRLGNLWGVDFTLGPIPDLYSPETWGGWSSSLVVSTSPDSTYSTTTAFGSGDEVYLSWLCACRGADVESPFYTALYVDDEYVYQWYSSGLVSGYGVCVTGHGLGRLSAGKHTVKIVYDSTDAVAEADEGNNVVTLTVTVADSFPDICFFSPSGWPKWPSPVFLSNVKDATSAKTSFAEGEPIYFYTRFGNNGTAAVANEYRTLIEVLDSYGSAISTFLYNCTAGQQPGEAGQWGGETFAVPQNLPPGRYVYRCTLDSGNEIAEIDEANNVVSIDFTVVATNCTVKFNANGGTVSPASRTVSKGAAVGSLPTPTWNGHTFNGWYTARTGGTKVTSTTKVNANVTYYAQWTVKQYKLSFNANGGTVSPGYKMVDYCKTCDTFPTPTWGGHTFNGWYTARSGGTEVTAPWKCTGNKTIYAQWTAKQYTITFNANGGTVSPASKKVAYCATYTLPTPTWSGHTFDGWYTAKTGGTKVTSPAKCTGNRTLYARWK